MTCTCTGHVIPGSDAVQTQVVQSLLGITSTSDVDQRVASLHQSIELKNEELEEYRKEIMKSIADLETAVASLSQHRNTLVPVSRLPPEILCNIFMFYRDRDQSRRDSEGPWPVVIWVSHHWRAVAFSLGALWNTPNLRWPGAAKRFLQLSSRATPIHLQLLRDVPDYDEIVHARKFYPKLIEVIDRMNFYKCRIVSFELNGNHTEIQVVISRTSFSSPFVTAVRLEALNYLHVFDCPTYPSLRVLELTRLYPTWSKDTFSAMKSLRVLFISVNPLDHWPAEATFPQDIPDILRSLPQLEQLSLEWCTHRPRDPLNTHPNVSHILLPKLSYLRLASPYDECRFIVDQLVIPRMCNISLQSGREERNDRFRVELDARFLLQLLIAAHLPRPTSLRFVIGETTVKIRWPSSSSGIGGRDLTFYGARNAIPVFNEIMPAVFPTATSAITVYCDGRHDLGAVPDWAEILANCADVTRFGIIDREFQSGWFEAFADAEASGRPFLPRLTTLVVRDIAWRNMRRDKDNAYRVWVRFLEVCQHCATNGTLRTIRTVKADASWGIVDALEIMAEDRRASVPGVAWEDVQVPHDFRMEDYDCEDSDEYSVDLP